MHVWGTVAGARAQRAGQVGQGRESDQPDSAEILLTRVHAGREKRTCGRHSRE